MRIVALFDPPEAHSKFSKWREEHEAVLADVPDDSVVIDTGRAETAVTPSASGWTRPVRHQHVRVVRDARPERFELGLVAHERPIVERRRPR